MYGRERENALLADLLSRAQAGRAAAIVVRGEPGVGKTMLVERLVATAQRSQVRVLRCQGIESESALAFAGLHQLLRPLASLLARLPGPQARALRVAFGHEEGATADPLINALAVLSIISEAAADQPVLVVVDDAHWLDDASSDALLFAARRLDADPVAMVFTARDGDRRRFDAEGIVSLEVTGLDEIASRALLTEHLGGGASEDVIRTLLAQSAGNPLALVEVPAGLSSAQRSGAAPLPKQLQLNDRLQRVFVDRCRQLPQSAQTLMLVAAADDTGSRSVVTRAAETLGASAEEDLRLAHNARLLEVGEQTVQVRHPLVRSALYQAATARERQSAHHALAAVLTTDPDRCAWHLAAATDGTDEAVAAAVSRAAERAERAAGFVAASTAFERASRLTSSRDDRAQWLFAAARNAWAAGQVSRAVTLTDQARGLAERVLLRADIDRLRARIELNTGSAATAHHIFTHAARSVAEEDPVRALEMRVAATLTHQHHADALETAQPWSSDERLPTDTRTRCLRHLLQATTSQAMGAAVPSLAEAVALADQIDDVDVIGNVGNAALHVGHDEGHRRCFTRMLAAARDRSAVMNVIYALPRLAFAEFLAGRWDQVSDGAMEARDLALAAGQRSLAATPVAWLTLLAAHRGDPAYADLRAELDLACRENLGVWADPVHDLSRWAAGVHAAHAGDASDALHHLSRMRVTTIIRMAAYDRLDAAVRAEDLALAASWTSELSSFAAEAGWAWARAVSTYGRALLGEDSFEKALMHHADADRPFERARTHLAFGEVLRRSQRRVDSRVELRAAHEVFQDLRAEPFAARAAQELRASGETARKRDPSTLTSLTPMELQVASLVSQGMSNKEAAAQLWISPRTVAFHLRGAFSKLGISSRGELAQAGVGPAAGRSTGQ